MLYKQQVRNVEIEWKANCVKLFIKKISLGFYTARRGAYSGRIINFHYYEYILSKALHITTNTNNS